MIQKDFQIDEEYFQNDENLTKNDSSTSGATGIRHLAKAGKSAFNELRYEQYQIKYSQLSAFGAHDSRN
jgi:hypothetical protein